MKNLLFSFVDGPVIANRLGASRDAFYEVLPDEIKSDEAQMKALKS